jgi:hypothetical protein
MAKLSDASYDVIQDFQARVKARVRSSDSIEEAAQRAAGLLYEEFRESIVLSRIYATIPYGKLPEERRRFVARRVGAKGVASSLEGRMVLSLMGTRGDEPAWNDRRASRDHLAIPLTSPFIDDAPMVARMLKDLGLPFVWKSGESAAGVQTETFGKLGGLFYVRDAASAKDEQGRAIISAQDFVSAHGVRTVFGVAGLYFLAKVFIVMIVFSREEIGRARAKDMMPLANMITSATSDIAHRGRLFAG